MKRLKSGSGTSWYGYTTTQMLAEVPEFEPVRTEGQLVKELLSGYQKRGRPVFNVSVLSDEDGNGFGYIGQPLGMRMKNQFEGNLSPKPN